jgi:hypothetical protein
MQYVKLDTDDMQEFQYVHVNIEAYGASGFIFSNTIFNPALGPTGAGATGFMFSTPKSSLRIGSDSNDTWDNINIGFDSFGSGNNVIASGDYSQAEGINTIASGYAANVDGLNNRAGGTGSYAGGAYAAAPLEGQWSRAFGGFSGATGSVNIHCII